MSQVEAVKTKTMTVEGYAIVFNVPSRNFGNYVEVIDPSALDDCDLSRLVFIVNHNTSVLLASTENDSLTFKVDEKGLYFNATITNTTDGQNAYKLIKEGILNKMSYGFFEDESKEKVYKDEKGVIVRRVMKIDEVYEISALAIPAYNQTELKAKERNMAKAKEKLHERELMLLQIELMEYESS
ncbi:HK97 family phage prohead protease [Carnobacterium maltaromaticum]|uniref:HK97 family phage prohead protease n=1 Tax=Carnobacterium maltaromaticum TaxID=2751 RepID=A0AAW9JUW4_CARML|nr:HK97 family phage prohead protease [Carnobacterium maltaromaticum]MDZ5759348.1 HK97 family phage prohead protease [Carnobacterium maltaromaticum]